MPRRQRQAPEGEITEGNAAVYEHRASSTTEVAGEVREGIRQMVLVNLEPATAWALRWTAAGFPAIDNVEVLRGDPMFQRLGERLGHFLDSEAEQTPVEAGDGIFRAVLAKRRRGTPLSSVAELTAIFDECVSPAQLEQSTRKAYWSGWRGVLTWGIAHDVVPTLLPMAMETVKALTLEMLMVGCSAGTVKNLWSAIEDRHRRYTYRLPFEEEGCFVACTRL